MKQKALLVEALASFKGPRVCIEAGVWLVDPPLSSGICVHRFFEGDKIIFNSLSDEKIVGPAVIQAEVAEDYEGDPVSLSIRQVQNAEV